MTGNSPWRRVNTVFLMVCRGLVTLCISYTSAAKERILGPNRCASSIWGQIYKTVILLWNVWDVKNTFEGVARPPCILPAKTTQTTFAFFPLRRPYSMLLWWWSSGLCPCLPGSNLSPGPPPVRGRQIALWILYKYIIKNKNTWPRCMGWVGCKCMKEKKNVTQSLIYYKTYVYCVLLIDEKIVLFKTR